MLKSKSTVRNGVAEKKTELDSVWKRTFTRKSEWLDKDEFLDVVYWSRQIIGLVVGIMWGLLPLKGFIAILLFALVNVLILHVYCTSFQEIDEEEYGGSWEIAKEGFMTSFAGFLVTWIIIYTGIHID